MLSAKDHYKEVLSRKGELEEELKIAQAQRVSNSRLEVRSEGVVYIHGGRGHYVSIEAQLTTYANTLRNK